MLVNTVGGIYVHYDARTLLLCAMNSSIFMHMHVTQAIIVLSRRRVEYGLVHDPRDVISDEDLKDTIQHLRQFQPYCGVSMLWGNLRARGIKVTRERVRCMLRSIDPLGRVLRCFPGTIRRQPYSVPGPNSLWHIGKLKLLGSTQLSCL